jgi:hypothetical protein
MLKRHEEVMSRSNVASTKIKFQFKYLKITFFLENILFILKIFDIIHKKNKN